MKKSTISLLFFSAALFLISKSGFSYSGNLKDSLRNELPAVTEDTIREYSIESLWVVGDTKERRSLKDQPLSSSIVANDKMVREGIISMKSLTGVVPNLYIPNYGTKLTSSIYVRGVGSRINNSAVGMYVDGIPYWDKSAFDFDYADIEHVEVLRGPQGTLYGRNTMGGLINISTKSPFDYSGTDFMISAATKNGYRFSLAHYHRISEKFAFSASGFGTYNGGFYRNTFNGKKIDKGMSGGGRMHGILRPNKNLSFDLNVSYEYCDDGGYPYGEYNKVTKEYTNPNYNFKSSYYRNLLNTGLITKYSPENTGITITSVSGWQYLRDRMSMDQDYTPEDRYTMVQMQKQNTISQEVIVKGTWDEIWGGMDFSTGVSGFYNWNRNQTPLTFGHDFISDLQATMDAAMSRSPIKVTLLDEYMAVPGLFHLPTSGAAIFHQSVFKDIFGAKGLSATLALRFDYEKVKIKYDTGAEMNYQTSMRGKVTGEGTYKVNYIGKQYDESMPLLPRLALKYDFNPRNNIYVLASKGYRGGGFNIQMLSDYMQTDLTKNVGTLENDETINAALRYRPEYSWNYELGSHLTFVENRISLDMSLFWMNIKDQQVSRFVESGLGRYTSNAGESRSRGMEISFIAKPFYNFTVTADYGFTDAKFVKNLTQVVVNEGGKRTLADRDFKDKRVPFAPKHTLHLATCYKADLSGGHALTFYVDYTGMGRIYFTEANDVYQNFYGLLDGRISYSFGRSEVALWCKNILNKDYALFYFDTTSSGFMQKGRGIQAGVDLRIKF